MNRIIRLAFGCVLVALTTWVSLEAQRFVFAQETESGAATISVQGARRALIVAVSHYNSGNFAVLPSADADVELLKTELLKSGFEEKNINVLQHTNGNLPTCEKIKNALDSFSKSCKTDDFAFIILIGRGLRDSKTQKDYFVPLDAKEDNFQTFLPLDVVIDSLDACNAKFKQLLVSVFAVASKGAGIESMGELTAKPGMLIFQNVSPDGKDYFTNEGKNSLFCTYFAEGLRGGAIDEDGRISALNACFFACKKAEEKLSPTISNNDFSDFTFVENDNWTRAADFAKRASEALESGDYVEASRLFQNAAAFDSPVQDQYRKKVELIEELKKINDEINEFDDLTSEDELVDIEPIDEEERVSIEPTDEDESGSIEPTDDSDIDDFTFDDEESIARDASALSESDDPSVIPSDSTVVDEWENGDAGDGRSLVINGVKAVFRYCPSGSFMMGSPESEDGRRDVETRHEVTLTHSFWMLETETTQKLWKAVMGTNPSEFKGDDLPVERVTWEECQEFIAKLNALEVAPIGMTFSLPTEAQWEYACRAGSKRPFPWGTSLNGDKANCDGSNPYGTTKKGTSLQRTTYVKRYDPNAWNLHDMCGNVTEWCLDVFVDFSTEPQTNPCAQENGLGHTVRGGCWAYPSSCCRSSIREYCKQPMDRMNFIGFRFILIRQDGSFASEGDATKDEIAEEETIEETDWENAEAGDGRTLKINGVKTVFRYCPPGMFTMGSPDNELGHNDFEKQRQVALTQGFWMMETETTQALWKAVTGDTPSFFNGDDLPVENVSWKECQAFVKKLNALNIAPDGFVFSLPSEAQWEYACRAGSTTAYPWGDTFDEKKANCPKDKMFDYTDDGDFYGGTTTVKSFEPNAWNLYDMCGNVGEWCRDYDSLGLYSETIDPCFDAPIINEKDLEIYDYGILNNDYQKLLNRDKILSCDGCIKWRPIQNILKLTEFTSKGVIRGGSWMSAKEEWCRSAERDSDTFDVNGCRLVLIRQ